LEFLGPGRKQISHMKRQHSRACTVYKNAPLMNLHDDSSEDVKLVKAKSIHTGPRQEEEEKSPGIV
jgi:hypothetical protein